MGRIAVKADTRDGYGRNLTTGKPVDNRDAYAVRGSLRFKPSDTLDMVLMADYFKEDDYNYAFHFFGTTVVPEDQLAHNLLGGRTIFDYYGDRGKKPDQRNIVSDQDPINERDGTAVSAIVDWGFADGWNLKSITAWRDFSRFLRDDLDGSDVDMFGQNNYIEDSESWSQDFTVSGTAANIDWLMGANYFSEKMHGEVKVPLTNLGRVRPAGGFLQRRQLLAERRRRRRGVRRVPAGEILFHRRVGPDAGRALQLRAA